MDVFLAIASKRDWRSYDSARPIPADVEHRILDAGRLAGSARNRQPWRFVVVESERARSELAQGVYVPGNVLTATLVVAIVTAGGKAGLDVGRAAQNMMLAAWEAGVVSCVNSAPQQAEADAALGLSGDDHVVTILTFAYPTRSRDPAGRTPEDWSAAANRVPLDELVRRA